MKSLVEFNKKSENPFKGLRKCLELTTAVNINTFMLDDAWNEVKDNADKKALFWSILFSVGDITGREHNIFKGKKVDGGGRAEKDNFAIILNWMILKHYEQFLKFLNAGLFNEYTCFDHLFRSRVTTKKKSTVVVSCVSMFSNSKYREDLANYIVTVLNGNNPFNKMLVCKFLTLPRLGKRSGHTKILPETLCIMHDKCKFLQVLSDKMGWDYTYSKNYANFVGYRNFRKQYNSDLESVLFSSGKIKEFDEITFKNWLNNLPSQARFRVKNRVYYSMMKGSETALKWPNLKRWFDEWEKFKEQKQAEQRILEEKVRQGLASLEDVAKLETVKKEAKVTVGANNFKTLYNEICSGNIDWLKMESFLQRIKLDYNTLVIVDDSGSMTGAPFNFATFLTSIFLTKNPDDNARNLLCMFSRDSRLYSGITLKESVSNRNSIWGRRESISIPKEPFVVPEQSFKENYQRINSFMRAAFKNGGTYFNTVAEMFKREFQRNPAIKDELMNYPVFTVLSDGDINSSWDAKSSIQEFKDIMSKELGFDPFIILIEITKYGTTDARKFEGLDNFLYINNNPAQIEQVLTNFKDIDVFDVYTPLQSMFRSNRYEPIRQNTI